MTACVLFFLMFSNRLILVSYDSPPPRWFVKQSGLAVPHLSSLSLLVLSCDVFANPGDNPPVRSLRALCGIRPGHNDERRGSFAAPHPHTALSDRARRALFMRLLHCGAGGDIVVPGWGVEGTAVTMYIHIPSFQCSTRHSR